MKTKSTPKQIIDFEPGDHLWNSARGQCFKVETSDGLVIMPLESGVRIAVPSTEMFYEVET
jgi:hypothetical protein